MKTLKKNQRLVCSILLCLNLVFIWGNSSLPGDTSGEISNGLLLWLSQLLGDAWVMGEYLLRKLAHFSEFAMLGLLLTWRFLLQGQTGVHRFTMPLLCGNLAACVDETIQVFSPDRGPSVIDVWIDTAGVTAGIVILLLGKAILEKKKHKNMEEI